MLCPYCYEKLDKDFICPKHDNISGLPIWRYKPFFKPLNKIRNWLKSNLQIDKDGNMIFQLLYKIEFLSFPELNYSSLTVFPFRVLAQDKIIKFWVYNKKTKTYNKLLQTNNDIFTKKRK